MNFDTVAKSICERNKALVTYIQENDGSNYQGVRTALTRVVSSISAKYNEGKFVSSKDLHTLTWAVINVANGDNDSTEPLIEEV